MRSSKVGNLLVALAGKYVKGSSLFVVMINKIILHIYLVYFIIP